MKKIIDVYIFKPHGALFKSNRKSKAKCSITYCENSENCQLYARGECSMHAMLIAYKCPYGNKTHEYGFTPAAKNYHSWINERENKYKDVLSKIGTFKNYMAVVGDYIFLPYAHMNMNKDVPFLEHGHIFNTGSAFIHKNDFTIDNIINICNFNPQAMIGGTITSYQKEVVPKFIKHLSEVMPDVYKELCIKYERAKNIIDSYNYKGRKAYLKTINKNTGVLVDIHKGEWIWDGEYLTSTNSKASFMLVNDFSELRLKPLDDAIIEINSNDQVNENTKFVN